MSSKPKINIKTIRTTNNGALILFNACNSAKVFTEVIDLANAQALVKLLEMKVPRLRKAGDIPTHEQEAWLQQEITLKLNTSTFETAKKGLDSLRSQGLLSGQKAVFDILYTFGIIDPDFDSELLMHLNADGNDEGEEAPATPSEPPQTAAAAG